MEALADFGHTMTLDKIKKGLMSLNKDLTFDPAGKLGHYHPNMDRWQGIWHNERHICSMDRGPVIPEHHVWAVVTDPDGSKRISHINRVGWRHTFKKLVDKGVPGITWENLCRVFGIDYKVYVGPKNLEWD